MSIKMLPSLDLHQITISPHPISGYIPNYTCDFDYPCFYHIPIIAHHYQQPVIEPISSLAHTDMENKPSRSGQRNVSIKKAIKYINGHLTENMSLNEVAEHVKLSPCYFSKLFKKQLGIGFNLYINQQRMKQAKLLLDMPELSIATVAKNLGFSQVSYFCRLFRQIYHITPQTYRYQTVIK